MFIPSRASSTTWKYAHFIIPDSEGLYKYNLLPDQQFIPRWQAQLILESFTSTAKRKQDGSYWINKSRCCWWKSHPNCVLEDVSKTRFRHK